jgi:hypothetical protein
MKPLPKRKPKKKETTKEKILRVLKETAGTMSGAGPDKPVDRASQFKVYMDTIDRLKSARVRLPGRVELGNLTAKSGKVGSVRTTNMSAIMDKYHDKALRMAQAKYYQKQLG